MKSYSNQIWNYKFQDAKKSLWAIPLFHGLVIVYFLMLFIISPRAILNLSIFIFFLVALKMSDLTKVKNIFVLSFCYLFLCLFELTVLGLPAPLLKIQNNSAVGKGIFLDVFFYTLPWIYVGTKFMLLILFFPVLRILRAR